MNSRNPSVLGLAPFRMLYIELCAEASRSEQEVTPEVPSFVLYF